MEISKFGSEFVALKVASEIIISLCSKLRIFVIPILVRADVFCGNEDVYKNTAFADYKFKKKHNSIFFHHVRECVAAGIMIVHKVHTNYNLVDILTKITFCRISG